MCDEVDSSMMNTVRVITIRPNPPSCQQNTRNPSRASDTGDRQDSDVESNEDEKSCKDHEKIRKFLDSNVSVFELIDRTSYLQQYPSWLGYCGPENKKKYTPTYINRNDNIWELVFSERGYVDMLLIVRDLYMKPFPKVDVNSVIGLSTDHLLGNTDLCTALFPCINELVASHEKIFRVLAGLHLEREDHVVPSLGAYLVQLFDPESLSSLSQLYGHFLYAQKRIRERLQACKNHARIAAFFQQVKQNPRSSRKSLEDCYMVIVQRWTKVETLLESIIRNTLNDDEEVANLEISRKAVKSIIKSSETILTEFEYTGKLREFAMLLDVSDSTTGTTMMSLSSNISSDELRLLNELKSPNAKLINHGRLYANPLVSGCGLQSSTSYEVEGVALKSCFFMLQKIPDSNRYQLFRGTEMPPILWWGKHYGYFRKSGEKASFGFYILLHSTTALTLFRCATVDELARWETIFNDGFAQWREHMDTFESLSEEFSKARDEIAEKQKRTEGILELLYQLNDKRLTFWKIWEFISSVLISERLAEMEMSTSKSESLPALTQNNSNRATIKVDVTSPPSTPNSNNNNNAQQITTMDMLKLHTFISNLDTYNDLDQLFDLFHEHFYRLSFALLSGPSSNLSRSASDVDGSKRPQINIVKKHETFSAHDSSSVASELRSSIDVGHMKSKKRDVHRLSATMASIFRTPSRDKNFTLNNQSSTDHGTNGSGINTTGSYRSIKRRQPVSSSSRTQQQLSGPPLPPRPSPTVLANFNLTGGSGAGVGVNEQLSPSSQLSFNPDSLITDASNLLISSDQPSSETLILLGVLNQIAGALFPQIQLLRTENVELRSTINKLETEQSNWKHFRNRDNQLLMRTSLNTGNGNTPHSDHINCYLMDNTKVKQETEKLRQDYENFTKKSHDWEKEYQKQRSTIEREHNKIAKERELLENERTELEYRQHQYEELRNTLQAQLNIYKKMGLKLTPVNSTELQELQGQCNSDDCNSQLNQSNSSIITNSFDDYLNELSGSNNTETNRVHSGGINDFTKPMHFYSNSDDLTGSRRTTTYHSTDLKQGYLYSPDADINPKPSLAPSGSTRSDHVPIHLRGSLVNQNNMRGQPNSPRSSDILSDNNRSNSNETSISSIGKSIPNSSSSSLFYDSNPLMKLVDHTKVRTSGSLSKSKKNYRSRSHQKDT
uniref:DH domain-containing protein n=1 Tax=Schistosoma mansoni TaxID=6183 RepID=A0A5K4F6E3_SCHMA